jgi:YidC/Oxa1 family membrane protein insertase
LPANKVENTAILRELVRGSQNLSEYFKSRNIAVENVTREQFIKAYEQIGGPKYVYVNSESSLSIEDVLVNPGEKITHGFRFYAGPADGDILASFDPHLNHVVAYTVGWFDFLSRWLVGLLKLIVSVVGNYGVAMILVTILVKTLLHPLTRKMLVSGHKMQLVGPKMKELQKRYAGDKARLNQEVMKLYRDEGVNPMGGCLPMLVQLPLFFALYGAFAKGFAGRQAMFIPGWISDLSLPDRLFEVGITIPFFDWEVPYFNLLPILYMILQILHMNMQPKATDPQQQQTQKMMRFMPIMFAFIFYKMPSGLVLYFTISTVYTLAEHWIIKRNLPSVPSGDGVGAALANNSDSVPVSAGVGIQQAAGKGKKKKKK